MITFEIILEEVTGSDNYPTDRQLSKQVQHPVVPRCDETIYIGGNGYPIIDVDHRIDTGEITVYAFWHENDFSVLWNKAAENSWQQTEP